MASREDLVTQPDTGKQVAVKVYRCRTCGLVFNDIVWRTNCEAPTFETKSMKQRRREDAAVDTLARIHAARKEGPDAVRRVMQEILDKHGPVPKAANVAATGLSPTDIINSVPDSDVVLPPGGSVLDKE